jgi:hypothetical protein
MVLIRTVLGAFHVTDQTILYGSRAKGTYKNGSDFDLTLIGSSNPDFTAHVNWVGKTIYKKDDLMHHSFINPKCLPFNTDF